MPKFHLGMAWLTSDKLTSAQRAIMKPIQELFQISLHAQILFGHGLID